MRVILLLLYLNCISLTFIFRFFETFFDLFELFCFLVLYFLFCAFRVVFLWCINVLYACCILCVVYACCMICCIVSLVLMLYACCKKTKDKLCVVFPCCIFVLYFLCCIYVRGILCYIFCVKFYAYGIFMLHFPRVEFLCCIFLCYIFSCCIKIISLYATASYAICLIAFWSDPKEENVSRSWETSNDSLPCDVHMFILKLSECKKFELSAAFLAVFANFLASVNNTFQSDFQLHFIFIVTI